MPILMNLTRLRVVGLQPFAKPRRLLGVFEQQIRWVVQGAAGSGQPLVLAITAAATTSPCKTSGIGGS